MYFGSYALLLRIVHGNSTSIKHYLAGKGLNQRVVVFMFYTHFGMAFHKGRNNTNEMHALYYQSRGIVNEFQSLRLAS